MGGVDVTGTPPTCQLAHVVVVAVLAREHVLDQLLAGLAVSEPRRPHTLEYLADRLRRVDAAPRGRSSLEVEDRRCRVSDVLDCVWTSC